MNIDEINKQIASLEALRCGLLAAERERVGKAAHLSKEGITALTWTMPAIPSDLYNMLAEVDGFRTGSSVYGNAATAADEDWCVNINPRTFEGYAVGLEDEGYWDADGFQSVYVHYQGRLLNIICFSDTRLMSAWWVATDTLTRLRNESSVIRKALDTKWSRVRLFRAIVDATWEPNHYAKPMKSVEDARKYSKCVKCSREATNFTTKAMKDRYLATGICERCI